MVPREPLPLPPPMVARDTSVVQEKPRPKRTRKAKAKSSKTKPSSSAQPANLTEGPDTTSDSPASQKGRRSKAASPSKASARSQTRSSRRQESPRKSRSADDGGYERGKHRGSHGRRRDRSRESSQSNTADSDGVSEADADSGTPGIKWESISLMDTGLQTMRWLLVEGGPRRGLRPRRGFWRPPRICRWRRHQGAPHPREESSRQRARDAGSR